MKDRFMFNISEWKDANLAAVASLLVWPWILSFFFRVSYGHNLLCRPLYFLTEVCSSFELFCSANIRVYSKFGLFKALTEIGRCKRRLHEGPMLISNSAAGNCNFFSNSITFSFCALKRRCLSSRVTLILPIKCHCLSIGCQSQVAGILWLTQCLTRCTNVLLEKVNITFSQMRVCSAHKAAAPRLHHSCACP